MKKKDSGGMEGSGCSGVVGGRAADRTLNEKPISAKRKCNQGILAHDASTRRC